MAGSFTSIHQCEKSLLIQEIDAIYRTRPIRARWGKSDRSVTCPQSLLGEVTPVGTHYSGSHRKFAPMYGFISLKCTAPDSAADRAGESEW